MILKHISTYFSAMDRLQSTYIKGDINMTYSNQPKTRRTFTSEFKAQLVALYHNGKRKCDIIR